MLFLSKNKILTLKLFVAILTTLVDSATIVKRPSTGVATLNPGSPLHFECSSIGVKNPEYLWFRKPLGSDDEQILNPDNDEAIDIHNERLTLLNPTSQAAGDYYCRAFILLQNERTLIKNESAMIKVRTTPYIEDFGVTTSHTGKSSTVNDGDRLELLCTVRDKTTSVNITWLRSLTTDDDHSMLPINLAPMTGFSETTTISPSSAQDQPAENYPQTFTSLDQSIVVQNIDSHTKKLIIELVRPENRGYYLCMADNGVTERSRRVVFIRVKDKFVALWPFIGIVVELFILFTIIYVWETQRTYKAMQATNNPPLLSAPR